jgi:hypothetical protein
MSSSAKDLGIISPTSQTLQIHLHNSSSTTLTVTQSISSLNSESSSTGFVIWRICPIFMEFISSKVDLRGKFVFELGSGIGGLGPLIVGKECIGGTFVASDQYRLTKLLKKNIMDNLDEVGLSERIKSETLELLESETKNKKSGKGKGKTQDKNGKRNNIESTNIEVCCFDWEEIDQGLYNLKQLNIEKEYPDLIIGCDIVYNDYLIPFLVESIVKLSGPKTKVIIGLQLRLLDNIENFVEQLLKLEIFNVHVVNEFPPEFQELENGFVVYYIERN